jgi:hypothetical protein
MPPNSFVCGMAASRSLSSSLHTDTDGWITAELRNRGYTVNHERVLRLK